MILTVEMRFASTCLALGFMAGCGAPDEGTAADIAAYFGAAATATPDDAVGLDGSSTVTVRRVELSITSVVFDAVSVNHPGAPCDSGSDAPDIRLEPVGVASFVGGDWGVDWVAPIRIFCGATVAVRPAASSPSLALDAVTSDGVPIEVRSRADANIVLATTTSFMISDRPNKYLFLVVDVSRLFEGIDLEAIQPVDGRIVMDSDSNVAELSLIEANLLRAFRLYDDVSLNRRLDAHDLERTPVACSRPDECDVAAP